MIEPVLIQQYNDPQGDLEKALKAVIKARGQQHPNDPRFIMDFSLEPEGEEDMHLQVSSRAMTPEQFLTMIVKNSTSAIKQIQG